MEFNSSTFKGKVALVTGSTFGIGRATAIAFAKAGASVVCADWENDVDTVSTIESAGGRAIFIQCDVAKEDNVKAVVEHAVNTFGRLDFAFNNAGIEGIPAATHEGTNTN
jgi:NAD(P)-dependent dehydrogenase (short-subunit alcohol dehydrogenase family)